MPSWEESPQSRAGRRQHPPSLSELPQGPPGTAQRPRAGSAGPVASSAAESFVLHFTAGPITRFPHPRLLSTNGRQSHRGREPIKDTGRQRFGPVSGPSGHSLTPLPSDGYFAVRPDSTRSCGKHWNLKPASSGNYSASSDHRSVSCCISIIPKQTSPPTPTSGCSRTYQ